MRTVTVAEGEAVGDFDTLRYATAKKTFMTLLVVILQGVLRLNIRTK